MKCWLIEIKILLLKDFFVANTTEASVWYNYTQYVWVLHTHSWHQLGDNSYLYRLKVALTINLLASWSTVPASSGNSSEFGW